MTVPAILLALRPLLAVLVVLFLIPWIFRRPLGEFTGFLRDLRSLLRAAEESKKLGPTERSVPDITKLFCRPSTAISRHSTGRKNGLRLKSA